MDYPIDIGLMIGGIFLLFIVFFMLHCYLKRAEKHRQDKQEYDSSYHEIHARENGNI